MHSLIYVNNNMCQYIIILKTDEETETQSIISNLPVITQLICGVKSF